MPGNRDAYMDAMNVGYETAWNRDWAGAATAYSRALQEFPEDAEAHLGLGYVLLQANRLNDALRVLNRAVQLAPEDPIPQERRGEVLERLGRLREAAEVYAGAAEAYLRQRDIDKAVAGWEYAVQLTPGLLAVHARLAQAYKRLGKKPQSILHYLILAHHFSRERNFADARRSVMEALGQDRKNAEALNALRAVEAGHEVRLPQGAQTQARSSVAASRTSMFDEEEAPETEDDPLGPMGEAMNGALNTLALRMMEAGLDGNAQAILSALQFQRQGLNNEAIEAYNRAARGSNDGALQMNLGALLLLVDRPDDAVRHLELAARDGQLEAGAYHALGQAHYHQRHHKRAFHALVQSARLVDVGSTDDVREMQTLDDFYDELAARTDGRGEGDDALAAANKRLIGLLAGKEWRRRIMDTRRHLQDAVRDSGPNAALEILAENTSDEVTEAVARIDRYMRQNKLVLAMEEAHYALERSPTYLPIHVRMAEILMKEGRIRQAISKYMIVARGYQTRGENHRAASILSEVLERAPLDVSVRRSLIDLLASEGRDEEVLDQQMELTETYRQLGNTEMARNTLAEAQRLAQSINAPQSRLLQIKHNLAEIALSRLETRQAVRVYEEILQLAPQDERARRGLMNLHYEQNNTLEATRHLDDLLRLYAQNKQVKNILALLQQLVNQHPKDGGLRSRLSAIYKQLGRREEAVQQLDALAELQLEGGFNEQAADTLRQIIRLNPERVDDYRHLLAQLGG